MATLPQRRVQRLDETVVNRIAAGEVLHRPANAVKELIENSLDAGATSIVVLVKGGGLKLLQISDNGSGISKEDLPLVCERFTTSKIRNYEDLQGVETYGFRGEALASISHVAHVQITSATASQPCAYKARYIDGKIVPLVDGMPAELRPCAGTQGTQIVVEELFYNVLSRRKALKTAAEEMSKISDIVGRYAIHNAGRAFTLKRVGEATADLQTTSGGSTLDAIRSVFTAAVARELVAFSCADADWQYSADGFISNAHFSRKKAVFIFFVNHRLVDCAPLKRALAAAYAALGGKNPQPFVYISLTIAATNLDVNVHPTKQEVRFLHESHIIDQIQRTVQDKLVASADSRTFYSQTPSETSISATIVTASNAQTRPQSQVRADPRAGNLEAFARPSPPPPNRKRGADSQTVLSPTPSPNVRRTSATAAPVLLTSVRSLREQIDEAAHAELGAVFGAWTFVGFATANHVLLQHSTKLFLIDVCAVTSEFFYQATLCGFGHFGRIRLSSPASLERLLLMALDSPESGWTEEDGSKQSIADYIIKLLVSRAPMLHDYFSMDIEADGTLHTLPQLIDGYIPSLERLPMFILRLGTEVEWERERECFESFSRELADFYRVHEATDEAIDTQQSTDVRSRAWMIQHQILPELRSRFVPSRKLATDGSVIEIACLEQLYKVFERC